MVICYNHEPIWIHHNQGPLRLHQGSFSGIHLMGLTLWKHRVFHCSKNPLCSTYSVLVAVQLLSQVQLFATPWTSACQDSLSFTISLSLLKLMSTESVMPFNHLVLCCPLLLPQSFPASGSFPVSQLFASGGQSIGALASVLPMNIHDWFLLELTGLISLQSKGLSRVFSSTQFKSINFSVLSFHVMKY